MRTSRTKMVAFMSGRMSLSKMKLIPATCDSTSKMVFRLASRNSRVTGRSSLLRSCGNGCAVRAWTFSMSLRRAMPFWFCGSRRSTSRM
ncbi:hypothetical protein D3C81_1561500 [compost metagenome]